MKTALALLFVALYSVLRPAAGGLNFQVAVQKIDNDQERNRPNKEIAKEINQEIDQERNRPNKEIAKEINQEIDQERNRPNKEIVKEIDQEIDQERTSIFSPSGPKLGRCRRYCRIIGYVEGTPIYFRPTKCGKAKNKRRKELCKFCRIQRKCT